MPFRLPVAGLLLAGALFLKSTVLHAEVIYDNSDTGGVDAYYSLAEYGDEIILASGTSRVINEFAFEYFGDFTPKGDETARVRIYKNDGPLTADQAPMPGTVLFDSGDFSISPSYQTKTFGGLNITVPTDMTWTVQFSGLTGTAEDRAGLVLRSKPSVGSSYDDFWVKQNTNWQLFSWGGSPVANFAARITHAAGTTLSIRRDTSNQIVVEWTGVSILQVADSAAGPYKDIPSARNSYKISPTAAAMKFWRLRD